jgi:pimeloyl-ACP methyl ester carboxylesterase
VSRSIAITIDVTEALGSGEPAHVALTIEVPETLPPEEHTIICFAKPGGGYTKEYYSMELPGLDHGIGSQAAWHADRGWIFVSIDHLGVGASSAHDQSILDTAQLARAAFIAETKFLEQLRNGTVDPSLPAIADQVVLGIGQSLGGSTLVQQQGDYDCYDGIATLAYSPIHQNASGPPGSPTYVSPYLNPDIAVNTPWAPDTGDTEVFQFPGPISDTAIAWSFFYFEETDWDLIVSEIDDFPFRNGKLQPWHSGVLPFTAAYTAMTPGKLAPKAAAIKSPVLVIMGDRDNVVDPWGEPRAFPQSAAIDLFICPRMGHMHNFAKTREIFWRRIHSWGEWIRECKSVGGCRERTGYSGASEGIQ